MWPWEHLAFGYVLYSLFARAAFREPLSGSAAVVVAVATQLPDLVDKPLSWTLGITSTGYSIGHSLFVAPAICVTAFVFGRRLGNHRIGVAFSIGYLSHLFGDVVYPIFLGRGLAPWAVLWPAVVQPSSESHAGFVALFTQYFARYVQQLSAFDLTPYVIFQLGLGLSVLLLWLYDGRPGVWTLYRVARRIR